MTPDRVRVTKRFHFEMAHALRCHDGLCANIHGHSYVLDVTPPLPQLYTCTDRLLKD